MIDFGKVVNRGILAHMLSKEFTKQLSISAEQEQLAAQSIAESSRRWGNGGNELPLDFSIDSAAKTEIAPFHQDLRNIFTYA